MTNARRGWGPARVAGTVLVGALVALTSTVAFGPPVAAHPSHKPQTLRISSDGPQVNVRWRAAPDDLGELALFLGVADGSRTLVYQDGELVPEESDGSDAELLAGSDQFPEYLLDHIQVRQEGRSCKGTVTDTKHLDHEGTSLRFDCVDDVEQVDVTVTTMTDVDHEYRTVARSSTGDRAVYTSHQSTHDWQLAAPDEGGSAAWLRPAAGSAAVLSGAMLLLYLLRRPRPVRRLARRA